MRYKLNFKNNPVLNSIENYDLYGNGRLSVYVSLYVYVILCAGNIFNINFDQVQAFFFAIPPISAIGVAHANNIASFKQRNGTYVAFLVFLSIGVFGFTLTEYSKYVILLFSFFLYLSLMIVTSYPAFASYRALIPPVFVISFLTILLGGVGQFYVAINRVITISVSGVIGYLAMHLIPATYYQRIWYHSSFVVLSRIAQQLKLIALEQSDVITFHGECVNRMNNSLGFTSQAKNETLFKKCSDKIQQFYFAIAYLYNSRNILGNNNYIIDLYATLAELQPNFNQHKAIPQQFNLYITGQIEKIKHNEIQSLWKLLALIINDWNVLCQHNR
ncbi:MAG: hypothetical protein EKK54_04865 [Neisseriaceae bacterium]|nr:MAG: hypothetical protein EKK54_04865 [Neisseriaceae bacterium]